MGMFESAEEFGKMLMGFFEEVAKNEEITSKLLASKLTIRFKYFDPDVCIYIDLTGDEVKVKLNDYDSPAIVEMEMNADIAHKFWFGKVNLMMALTRGQMKAKGPVPKILKLLPVIKPTYAMYPKYLKEHGYEKYIIY